MLLHMQENYRYFLTNIDLLKVIHRIPHSQIYPALPVVSSSRDTLLTIKPIDRNNEMIQN